MRAITGVLIISLVLGVSLFMAFGWPAIAPSSLTYVNRGFAYRFEASNVSEVSVSNSNGYVVVKAWDGPYIQINVTEHYFAFNGERVAVGSGGGRIYLAISQRSPLSFLPGYANVTVMVPEDAALSINASTVNGDVFLTLNDSGLVSATTVNGVVSIAANRIGGIYASTVNGMITASWTPVSGGVYRMSTTNGDLEVHMPPGSSFSLDANTVNGEVSYSGPPLNVEAETGTSLVSRYGNASSSIVLSTVNGLIRISVG